MQVRQYRPGDEATIATIHNSGYAAFIDSLPVIYQYRRACAEEVLAWLAPVTNTLWVVESQGKIVGYAQVRIEVERGKEDVPVLQFMPARKWDLDQTNIAVLPAYQRKGVGSFLTENLLKEYHGIVKFATALTFSDNVAGERLFQKLGFSQYDAFYYPPFSEEYPLANSSVYESLKLDALTSPDSLNQDMMFRRAVVHDAPIITEIHQNNVWWCDECGTLDWNIRFIEGSLGHTVFVAEINGEVVGEMDYYKDGRIGIAGILPQFRNQGIGSTMFYRVMKTMREAGFKFAFVDSGLTQTEAIKMYKRFGFTVERRQNSWVRSLT